MKQNDGSQTFSCMSCGAPYTVYPPQTGYKNAMLEPCTEGCDLVMNFRCKECKKEKKIYWCSGHFHVVSSGPNIDNELDRRFPF